MRLMLSRALVAMYRALCALTLHRWHYYRNVHGGKPLFRSCIHCGKRQTWHYGLAREHGIIKWVGYGSVNDFSPDHEESGLAELLRSSAPASSDATTKDQSLRAAGAAGLLGDPDIDGVTVSRNLAGWVRDEDGNATEPAFIRGAARPPSDLKGNYRPVVYDTDAAGVDVPLVPSTKPCPHCDAPPGHWHSFSCPVRQQPAAGVGEVPRG